MMRVAVVFVLLAACGKPAGTPPTGDGPSSGMDAGMDGAQLTPEPPDPASTPCAGLLGFPGPPALVTRNAIGGAAGDLDGDGRRDLVFVSDGLSVAHGNGDGTFGTLASFVTASPIGDMQIVDVDGDGKPEVVYGGLNNTVYDLRIAHNDGNGGLVVPPQVLDDGNVRSDQVVVEDLDGNGKKDLIGLDASSGRIVVLLADATGFAAPLEYSVGTQYTDQIAVGDFTGDGRPDLVAANLNTSTVSALVNKGDGTFAARVPVPTPAGPWAIALADVNEDGKRDIVVGTSSGVGLETAQVSVLLNQGGATFGGAVSYPAAGGEEPRSIAVADIDGDGHLDIAAATPVASDVALLFGTGTGQFGMPTRVPYEATLGVDLHDYNGDGRTDVTLLSARAVTAFLNNATSAPIEARRRYTFGLPALSFELPRLLDLNADGMLDLVALATAPAKLFATRTALGATSYAPTGQSPTMLFPSNVVLGDVDNDGHRDLVLYGSSESVAGIQTMLVHGDGLLAGATPSNATSSIGPELVLADIDGDGRRDLIAGDQGSYPDYASEVRFYPGLGDGTFGAGVSVWTGPRLQGIAAIDLDGNGRLDLVVDRFEYTVPQSTVQSVLLATGHGAFAPPVESSQPGLPTSLLSTHDVNGDGKPDLVGFHDFDGVVVMLGNGDGTLGAPLLSPGFFLDATEVAFADFDGDGHVDLVTATRSGTVAVLLGRGDGTFQTPRFYHDGEAGPYVSVGDADGDGRVDILVGDTFDGLSVLPGRCLQ